MWKCFSVLANIFTTPLELIRNRISSNYSVSPLQTRILILKISNTYLITLKTKCYYLLNAMSTCVPSFSNYVDQYFLSVF